MIMNGTQHWNGHIERIYWAVSRSSSKVSSIQVRTALTVFGVTEICGNDPIGAMEACAGSAKYYVGLGTSRSLCAISSIDTSRKVRTLALFTKRAGRYISQTQASPIETS